MSKWTRKLTYPGESETDWVVLRDGFVVGRTFWDRNQSGRERPWLWAVITTPTRKGFSATMEEALEHIREAASDDFGIVPYTW